MLQQLDQSSDSVPKQRWSRFLIIGKERLFLGLPGAVINRLWIKPSASLFFDDVQTLLQASVEELKGEWAMPGKKQSSLTNSRAANSVRIPKFSSDEKNDQLRGTETGRWHRNPPGKA